MPEGSHARPAEVPQALADIETLYRPTHDEVARQRLVSALRKHVLVDKGEEMRAAYQGRAAADYATRHGHPPRDHWDIREAMRPTMAYRVYSALRVNAQEMTWSSVADAVERRLPEMIEIARDAARLNPAGGSLRIDPAFKPPGYVADLDVHHIPGSFTAELTRDDVAIGAVAAHGTRVFSGGLPHRKDNPGAVAESVAHYLKLAYPDFAPRRILDCGTGIGKNLAPYRDVYPDAECYGIDVAAPGLRYGHALFEHQGIPLHLSQQNAERTDFPDGFFDLIVSSFFFHEMPVAATRRILRENYRLLAPRGRLAHMELPPNVAVDAYTAFVLDWDNDNNYEPDYADYRSQVPTDLCAEAGFAPATCWQRFIPNWRTFGADRFARFVKGACPPPPYGHGGAWFIFGAER
jgi:SAM-dependent methyltransferase